MNENISAVVMDRIIGTISGIILLTISFFFGMFEYIGRNAVIIIFSALGGVIVFFAVLFFPRFFRIDVILRRFKIFSKIRPKLGEFHDRLISYRYKIKYLAAALFFSLILQTFFITSYYFVSLSLGLKMKYQMLLFTQPFAALASGFPIAIGGMGIRENALAFAIESFGVSRADSTLFSFIVFAIILFNALAGGLIYLLKNVFYKSKGMI